MIGREERAKGTHFWEHVLTCDNASFAFFDEEIHSYVALIGLQSIMVSELLLPLISSCPVNLKVVAATTRVLMQLSHFD